jgi:hypothetical protein
MQCFYWKLDFALFRFISNKKCKHHATKHFDLLRLARKKQLIKWTLWGLNHQGSISHKGGIFLFVNQLWGPFNLLWNGHRVVHQGWTCRSMNMTTEVSPLITAIISEGFLHNYHTRSRGRCLGLGATRHLREACWKYPSEATAASFYVGEVATLFFNGAVERLRSRQVGGRHTSSTASSTKFCHNKMFVFLLRV